ncbi:MAG: urea ABC transporter ATP-binding subunit UrtE [Rhodobacteraceae bacterium]|jgi:urea ABC transporter, ATP-binding protein UrtE|nr:urea ABC transporter ATP-binding subunit UrtE [Paracoccaceae bacterium]HCJ61814.1 urea ABC transporter ATP-binding subunit UrtE [Alphaproteobacteria bacterium]
MLDCKDITLHYGQSQILNGISMSAEAGRVTCVMGVNGVGKTSLLKVLSGVHSHSGGSYRLNGEVQKMRTPSHQLAKMGVGYVPQGRDIFPLLTVKENLETGFGCLPRGERCIPEEIYELFPVLKEMQHRRGGDLSGGQQQQLAIARALITKPKLLLLDEPTEGIQPNIIQQIGRVINYLKESGNMAIVLVEQYFDFAFGLADHIYVMERGTIILNEAKGTLSKSAVRAKLAV